MAILIKADSCGGDARPLRAIREWCLNEPDGLPNVPGFTVVRPGSELADVRVSQESTPWDVEQHLNCGYESSNWAHGGSR